MSQPSPKDVAAAELVDQSFAENVSNGLARKPKRLSSMYFYDDEGSRIFQEIMQMPEYYLTDCELEIMQEQSADIVEALASPGGFNVVELGAGDGFKTRELLRKATQLCPEVTYFPIDISAEAMDMLEKDLSKQLPELPIKPQVGDYFEVLDGIDWPERPSLFLFLGSNIGNYEADAAVVLLSMIHDQMRSGDKLLIGFDLKKYPPTILAAYNDKAGITRRFNLNLLTRMNRELGANFAVPNFDFYPYYNPYNGEVRSCLVSLKEQSVSIEALDKTFHFDKDEPIFTELSKKYSLSEIEKLASPIGFRHVRHFQDSRHYFSDSLFEKM